MRDTAENAELALLLEVSGTPKPGNVDREREYPDLRFEQFVAGAVGARRGFNRGANGGSVGVAFEEAIEGMSTQRGGNTQFGAVLLVTPLVVAAAEGNLSPAGANSVVEATTVEDAIQFYRAFDHVAVAVDEPSAELSAPDVRLGSEAEPVLRERGLTLADVMAESAERDGIAAEWVGKFSRTFDAADRIEARDGPVTDRAAAVYLELLTEAVDTFVVTQHDRETAREVKQRAQAVLDGEESVEALANEFIDREINPGTTADLIAGGLFVALERGLEV